MNKGGSCSLGLGGSLKTDMYDDLLGEDMFSLEAGEGRTSECSGGMRKKCEVQKVV